MPSLHVCPLSRLGETAAVTGASHLVSLLGSGAPVGRPAGIAAERHLSLRLSDIVAPLEGHVLPECGHVEAFLAFVREWERTRHARGPLLIHCWAGISRSTAAAYIAACALRPGRCEDSLALGLRTASPTATPNPRLVSLADDILDRGGRMRAAIGRIGRGADAFEGTPFALRLD